MLHRGEPTTIWVINRSTEPSQVHWHGLEIDSYYDGVAGLSGGAGHMARDTPVIMPNDSFEVHVTPPRAGSFMYHTHINDLRQQSHGLYGPLVVLETGEAWDPDRDCVFILGTDPNDQPVLNGKSDRSPATLQAGTSYRFRLMNITLDNPGAEFRLVKDGVPVTWARLASDGYGLPPWQADTVPARQLVSIGQTFDAGVMIRAPVTLTLEVRAVNGRVLARQPIRVVR